MNKHIYNILVLKNYLRETFGVHVPYEIIQLIIMAGYPNISISCGWKHTCMILNNEVYAWGSNDRGQLGLGNDTNTNYDLPQKLNLRNIKKIICGEYHTMALDNSGEVYAWGHNYWGQLGLGNNTNYDLPQKLNLVNIKKIICGGSHTMALDNSGEVYAWGSNISGQLGLGNNIKYDSPQKLNLRHIKKIICGSCHTVALISARTENILSEGRMTNSD